MTHHGRRASEGAKPLSCLGNEKDKEKGAQVAHFKDISHWNDYLPLDPNLYKEPYPKRTKVGLSL